MSKMMEDLEEDFGEQLPVGYRFVPTDEELVTHYLINRVFCNTLQPSPFQDINASKLYSKSPKNSGPSRSSSHPLSFQNCSSRIVV